MLPRVDKAEPRVEPIKEKSELDKRLCYAVVSGDASVVKDLLETGANRDVEYSGKPLPHTAAMYGHMQVVEEFLKAGVSIDCCDKKGDTLINSALVSFLPNKVYTTCNMVICQIQQMYIYMIQVHARRKAFMVHI